MTKTQAQVAVSNITVSYITVLALGSWGTALAQHLASKGHDVLGWAREKEVVDSINANNSHPSCFKDQKLNFKATTDLELALKRPILVLAFPSSAMAEMLSTMRLSEEKLIVSALKGLNASTLQTPLQYLTTVCPKQNKSAVLSGPSFAIDLVNGRPLGMLAASNDSVVARKVAELFSAPNLKVYLSDDPLGVELGGILKNVIAIAVGVCDGLGCGDSARAGLITRGLAEITRLAQAMGARSQTLFGLSGLGDLIMTASCNTSRNRTVGLRLGQGENLDTIIKTLGAVAEGVVTTPLVLELAKKHNVEMPITERVDKILKQQLGIKEAAKELLSRPMKTEF
jgi:glycerol-3-phosphate dehydrogenase (NAD(P)+)